MKNITQRRHCCTKSFVFKKNSRSFCVLALIFVKMQSFVVQPYGRNSPITEQLVSQKSLAIVKFGKVRQIKPTQLACQRTHYKCLLFTLPDLYLGLLYVRNFNISKYRGMSVSRYTLMSSWHLLMRCISESCSGSWKFDEQRQLSAQLCSIALHHQRSYRLIGCHAPAAAAPKVVRNLGTLHDGKLLTWL